MSEANKAVVRRVVDEVLNGKNLGQIEQLYDSTYVGHNPDGDLRGHAGARQLFDRYLSAFPDCQVTIDDLIAEGDKVTAIYTFSGTHKGDLMGVAPSGKQISVRGITSIRVQNGKVAEDTAVWDTLSLMQQIGAVPAAAKPAS